MEETFKMMKLAQSEAHLKYHFITFPMGCLTNAWIAKKIVDLI